VVRAFEPGRLEVRLGASGLAGSAGHLAECPDLGPACAETPPPVPYHHHVALFMTDVTADVSYQVTPWLAAEARLLLRIVDTYPTYTEIDGRPKLVPDDIHHHDRTIVGPGDPWLMARFSGNAGNLSTAARLGLSFPLGRTEPDPFRLGAAGQWHEHIQLGTGTFLPIVGVGLTYELDPVEISASALGLFSVYENDQGFRAPTRIFGGLRLGVPLLGGKVTPYATVDLAHESAEIWHGAYALEGFNARTDLLAGIGATWSITPAWRLEGSVRARVVRLTDAAAFNYPGMAQISISRAWDLGGKDDDEDEDTHGHGH